jgi:hypothetical protein
MIDLYTTTLMDMTPAHVTELRFAKKLRARLATAQLEKLKADLQAQAKPSCKACYGRGFSSTDLTPCKCTQKSR